MHIRVQDGCRYVAVDTPANSFDVLLRMIE